MIFFRSRKILPLSNSSTLDDTVLKESVDFVILGVTIAAKMTFEKHLCSVSIAAAKRLFSWESSCKVFHGRLLLPRSFSSFVLSVVEYFSAVWCSAEVSHIKLLNRIFRNVSFISCAGGVLECNLAHRRSVAVFAVCAGAVTQSDLVAHIGICLRLHTVKLLNTGWLLCPSPYLHGTIQMTLCKMVWDCGVLRTEPMPSCWHNQIFLFVSYYFVFFCLPRVACVGLLSSDW